MYGGQVYKSAKPSGIDNLKSFQYKYIGDFLVLVRITKFPAQLLLIPGTQFKNDMSDCNDKFQAKAYKLN